MLPHEVDIRLLDAIDAVCSRLVVLNINAEPGAFSGFVALEDNLEKKIKISFMYLKIVLIYCHSVLIWSD